MNAFIKSQAGNTFFISAGEVSGDMHGAELVKALKKLYPGVNPGFYPGLNPGSELSFSGLGGDNMTAQGFKPLYHVNDLATVGFTDVIKKYGFFKKAITNCAEFIRQNNPDAVILIDYPGFNIRLAEKIKSFYKGKIFYYISPQLWAWHEKRVYKIKKFVDKMLVVFPFEKDFYKKFGIEAEYVGHPLVKKVSDFLQNNPVAIQENRAVKTITVLPGSRKDEISKHMPVILETLKLLKRDFELNVNISIAPGMENLFSIYKDNLSPYNLTGENVYKLIQNSDVVMAKAGTSTMECSLIGTPYLIFYKTFPLNYYILKPIVKIDKLGIANILSGKSIVKEFIQHDFTPVNLYEEVKIILTDKNYAGNIKAGLQNIWDILGSSDASENAAKVILNSTFL